VDAHKSPYEILGIDNPKVKKNQIRKAYLSLSKYFHPDNPETGDDQKFKDINEAYKLLMDDNRRKLFDEYGVRDVDTIERHVTSFISEKWMACLQRYDPDVCNPLDFIRASLQEERKKLNENIHGATEMLSRLIKARGRLSKRNGVKRDRDEIKIDDNFLFSFSDLQVKSVSTQIADMEKRMILVDVIENNLLEILDSYSYDVGHKMSVVQVPGFRLSFNG